MPLPQQALALLRELWRDRVANDQGKGWVFTSPVYPGRPINPTSMLKSFQRTSPEYNITAHGFRATYRTIVHEHLGIAPIVLELSLSHRMPGALGAVYARAQLLGQRREAAQMWLTISIKYGRMQQRTPHTKSGGQRYPLRSHLERETRLASGLRAIESKGFSAIPKMGIALFLDSFSAVGKPSG